MRVPASPTLTSLFKTTALVHSATPPETILAWAVASFVRSSGKCQPQVDARDAESRGGCSKWELARDTGEKGRKHVTGVDEGCPHQGLVTSILVSREQVDAEKDGSDPEHPEQIVRRRAPLPGSAQALRQESRNQQRQEPVGEPNDSERDPRRVPHDPTRGHGAKAFETPPSVGISDG
jgi:hypothetical protein